MTRETVNALIDRVMADHPFDHKVSAARQLKYYESVHQELAPLARALEAENAILRKQLQDSWSEARAAKKSQVTHVWTCSTCDNVYRGGQKDVTVFAENGRVYCRSCVRPARAWAAKSMTETTEERA